MSHLALKCVKGRERVRVVACIIRANDAREALDIEEIREPAIREAALVQRAHQRAEAAVRLGVRGTWIDRAAADLVQRDGSRMISHALAMMSRRSDCTCGTSKR
jgi:hypothetical protein